MQSRCMPMSREQRRAMLSGIALSRSQMRLLPANDTRSPLIAWRRNLHVSIHPGTHVRSILTRPPVQNDMSVADTARNDNHALRILVPRISRGDVARLRCGQRKRARGPSLMHSLGLGSSRSDDRHWPSRCFPEDDAEWKIPPLSPPATLFGGGEGRDQASRRGESGAPAL